MTVPGIDTLHGHIAHKRGGVRVVDSDRLLQSLRVEIGHPWHATEGLLEIEAFYVNLRAVKWTAHLDAGVEHPAVQVLDEAFAPGAPAPPNLIGWLTDTVRTTQATCVWIGEDAVRAILAVAPADGLAVRSDGIPVPVGPRDVDGLAWLLEPVARATGAAIALQRPDFKAAVVL